LNDMSLQSIRGDEGCVGDDELTCARDAAGAPEVRIVRKQPFDVLQDMEGDTNSPLAQPCATSPANSAH
jgi:hypothetical protein